MLQLSRMCDHAAPVAWVLEHSWTQALLASSTPHMQRMACCDAVHSVQKQGNTRGAHLYMKPCAVLACFTQNVLAIVLPYFEMVAA